MLTSNAVRLWLTIALVLAATATRAGADFFEYMDQPDQMDALGYPPCYAGSLCDMPVFKGDGHDITYVVTYATSFGVFDTRLRYDRVNETTAVAPYVSHGDQSYGFLNDATDDDVYSAFDSIEDTWAPGDTNNAIDVFVLDPNYSTVFGHWDRVSVTSSQTQVAGDSTQASMSADARYVVFQSTGPLAAGDTNGTYDVYLRDRVARTTERISSDPLGGAPASGALLASAGRHIARTISGDGNDVVFIAGCDILPGGCPIGLSPQTDLVLLRDRALGATELVSKSTTGEPRLGIRQSISGDGSKIVYVSDASDIVAGDTNDRCDLFIYDRPSDTTLRIPLDDFPEPCNYDAMVSNDGHVVFSDFEGILLWANCPAIAPVCGDGTREQGCEECDDGNLADGDGCDSNCTPTGCGNGIATSGEQCDDGNSVDGDGCDTNCTTTACGNGIKTAGEVCEDGNTTAGDGCSPTCQIEPGELTAGGTGKSDCLGEMLPLPQPPEPDGVFPVGQMTCRDGDASCDFGPAGDGACRFRVAFCVNVPDPRLACTPTDVASIEITKPKYNSYASTDADNRYQLLNAFSPIGSEIRRCTKPDGAVGMQCYTDANCGTGGKCGKPLVEASPPVTATSVCTDYAEIEVPLKLKKTVYATGKGQIALRYRSSPDAAGKVRQDTDKLKLVCNP